MSFIGHSNSISPFRLVQPSSNSSNISSEETDANLISAGTKYRITVKGDTDFTLIGSANSEVNTIFTATGAGAGTGKALAIVEASLLTEDEEFSEGGVKNTPYKVLGHFTPVLTTAANTANDGRSSWGVKLSLPNGLNRIIDAQHHANYLYSWVDGPKSIKFNITSNNSGELTIENTVNSYGENAFFHTLSNIVLMYGA